MTQQSSTLAPHLIAQLRDALRRPLPGPAAQALMSPDPRPGAERGLAACPDSRQAGVLALLYPSGDDLCLVLTLRTQSVESHRGQISFPGGAMDPGEIPEETALREAYEELGINPLELDVLTKTTLRAGTRRIIVLKSAAVMSGPGRLNLAAWPSKLPCPNRTMYTTSSGAAALANPASALSISSRVARPLTRPVGSFVSAR